ncbi:hypothetical protein VTI74DRAFT_3796 [Chaetomium olivicolor]
MRSLSAASSCLEGRSRGRMRLGNRHAPTYPKIGTRPFQAKPAGILVVNYAIFDSFQHIGGSARTWHAPSPLEPATRRIGPPANGRDHRTNQDRRGPGRHLKEWPTLDLSLRTLTALKKQPQFQSSVSNR